MASFRKSSSIVFAQVLAFLMPVSLGMYWVVWVVDRPVAILLFRPLMVATSAGLALLLALQVPTTHAEKTLALTLGLLCAVLLVPSIAASDPVRAMLEWVKLFIICAFSLMLCRVLRHPPTAKTFGGSLLLGSVILGILIIAIYVKYIGMVTPTYAVTRVFKGAMLKVGISLNSIAFDCVFAYVCAMCLLRSRKYYWFLGGVLLAIASTLTGSRAPLAVFGLGVLALLAINALRSRRLLVRVAGAVLAAAMVIGAAMAITLANSSDLSSFTEGRWELWSVACRKFTERPLLGYGYQSVQDDPTYIPGGYHNAYLTAAAEQGLMGSAAVMVLFWFLLRRCWNLSFRSSYTWRNGQWALLGCFLLLLHATVEAGGLFGTAQGPGDFLAYIFLAIVVSRYSREEEYITACRRHAVGRPAPITKVDNAVRETTWIPQAGSRGVATCETKLIRLY